eukprot:m.103686 g.103686  ORF g.103686 m.103686 type:complete len:404 (+) comp15229_c0_seq2:127-1338(+)
MTLRQPNYITHPIEDDYRVDWDNKVGTGINGAVYACYNEDGVRFALKCLSFNEKAQSEVAIQNTLSGHPNIVRLQAAYVNVCKLGPADRHMRKKRILMVMEYCSGGELFDRIASKQYFTEKEASAVMKQLADVIYHCHQHNIAHRDIKPENLLYATADQDAALKLCDFGFAKVDENMSTPVFTPYYVAPQVLEAQVNQRKKDSGLLPQSFNVVYDKACDMWSAGVVLYIMCCGYPPFRSDQRAVPLSAAMKQRIRTGTFAFHDEYWKDVSEEAKQLVRGLLEVNALQRLNAQQLRQAQWIQGDAVKPTPLKTPRELSSSANERDEDAELLNEELEEMRTHTDVRLKSTADLGKNAILARRSKKAAKAGKLTLTLASLTTQTSTAAEAAAAKPDDNAAGEPDSV